MTTAPADGSSAPARRAPALGVLQRLGRSLMLPIAALPVAALLLRLGQPDMLGDGASGLALGARWPWLTPVADVLAAARVAGDEQVDRRLVQVLGVLGRAPVVEGNE